MNGWSWHYCPHDPNCCTWPGDPPARLQIGTPVGTLTIAFRRDSWLSMWLPWKTRNPLLPIEKFPDQKSHYTRWTSPIAWQPRRKNRS